MFAPSFSCMSHQQTSLCKCTFQHVLHLNCITFSPSAMATSSGSPMNSMTGTDHHNVTYHSINDDVAVRTIPWYGRCCPGEIRLVNRKNARSTLIRRGFHAGYFGYLTDSFTTLINSRWWVILLVFFGAYLGSWLFFACFWTVAAYADGRFNGTCIVNLSDFSSAVLFSIEVQNTIGFGNKYVRNDCHWGILILILQCILGLFIDSILLGLIFAKLTRPRNRRKTILFSKNAVVRDQDGEQVLELRIANLRQSQIVEAHVRLRLYWYKLVDTQNMFYELEEHDLECGYDNGTDRVLLLTPVLLQHKITETSPLYGLTQTELNQLEHMEIVVILEGIVEATGLTVQALWSYTKDEILFNHKFGPVIKRNPETLRWEVDLDRIDNIVPIPDLTGATPTDEQ